MKHGIILALKRKGINNAEIIYASHWSTDAGWTMVKSDKGSVWLGFTKKEAILAVSKIIVSDICINGKMRIGQTMI